MMRRAGILAAGIIALTALASCTVPFTSRTTITPIYAATSKGLSVFNGSSWTNYLAGDQVNAVTVYGSGANAVIYAATQANGVQYYDGSSWGPLGSGLPSPVNSIFLGNNYLYAGTGSGLFVYSSSSNTWARVGGSAPTSGPGVSTTTVNDIYSDGTAYVATSTGIWISDLSGTNGFVQPSHAPPGSTAVTAVFFDQAGDLLAGTTGTSGGLQILPSGASSWNSILSAVTVNSIFVDPYSDIYAGTDAGLAVSLDGGSTWTTYTTAAGLAGNTVNQVFVVGNSIYAATSGGVSVSTDNGQTWTSYTVADGLGSSTVNGLFVSPPLYSFGS